MIVFKCPICALKLQTDPSVTGRRVRCPRCRGVAVVLAPSAVRVMPPPLPAALAAADGHGHTDLDVVDKEATAHAREAAKDFHLEAEEREASPGPVPPERDFHLEADDEEVPYLDPVEEEILDVQPADDDQRLSEPEA